MERKVGADWWISAMRRNDGSVRRLVAINITTTCPSWIDYYTYLFAAGDIYLSFQREFS